MSSTIVDRRLNPNKKSLGNRQRFIERHKEQIKRKLGDLIEDVSIKNVRNKKISVPIRGTREPIFSDDHNTGTHDRVITDNEEWVRDDKFKRNSQGQGNSRKASDRDDGDEDVFEFSLTPDEFLAFFFDDLELPNLLKRELNEEEQVDWVRKGYTNVGAPASLHLVQTYCQSLSRRLSLNRPSDLQIEELRQLLAEETDPDKQAEIQLQLEDMERRQKRVPWIDDLDLRYRHFEQEPQPTTQAVVFCTMDVSGSMGEDHKDLAKRFYLLMYLLLMKKYKHVDIVFVRHTAVAEEVDQDEFFYGRVSGGTIVSSALEKVNEIIAERYSPRDWNIYVAHASDGDNWDDDNIQVEQQLEIMMPNLQYYAYLETAPDDDMKYDVKMILTPTGIGIDSSETETSLWKCLQAVKPLYPHLQMKRAHSKTDIWTVFRELFSRKLNGSNQE